MPGTLAIEGRARGRIRFDSRAEEWLRVLEAHPLVEIAPLSADVVLGSVNLGGGFHGDPADQIMVAAARCRDPKLLTMDERSLAWGKVRLAERGGAWALRSKPRPSQQLRPVLQWPAPE